jgi:FkbM family methyltransferase
MIEAALAVALVAVAALARLGHRRVWREVFRLRAELVALHRELVAARKACVLATAAPSPRLPLMMPSQNGEDVVLWEFFEGKRDGFYVEVGAYDGVGFSNTYFFEAVGWDGLLVEAVPSLHQAACQSRPNSRVVHAAAGRQAGTVRLTVVEGEGGVATLSSATPDRQRIVREGGRMREIDVPLVRLDSLLEDVRQPIDFVSIDVEGLELAVLEGFDLQRFAPRVLVVEDNAQGADPRVPEYLGRHGYVERFRLEQNAFYTRRDDVRPIGWSS